MTHPPTPSVPAVQLGGVGIIRNLNRRVEMADPLTKARKFVRENPLTAEREGVDIAIEYAGECRKERAALLSALRDLMDDYLEAYDSLTDGQYGKPTTAAAKRAASLLMKLSK